MTIEDVKGVHNHLVLLRMGCWCARARATCFVMQASLCMHKKGVMTFNLIEFNILTRAIMTFEFLRLLLCYQVISRLPSTAHAHYLCHKICSHATMQNIKQALLLVSS